MLLVQCARLRPKEAPLGIAPYGPGRRFEDQRADGPDYFRCAVVESPARMRGLLLVQP